MAKIGFYGGTFNPPTKAHIELAKKTVNECELDKVIFVPVNDLYKKEEMAKSIDRLNMLKIICNEEEKLEVSDIEMKKESDYKAIDIFRIIEKQYKKDENYFIMGTDNLIKLPEWKDSKSLASDFKYIILDRGDIKAEEVIENNILLKEHKENFKIIKNIRYRNYSSTYIRNKIKKGEIPLNINRAVYNYIKENKIYL